MGDLLIHDVRLATRDAAPGWLLARGGRIEAVGTGAPPPAGGAHSFDGGGRWLLPGFIDAHIHGSGGEDVMAADPAGLRRLSRSLVAFGVTAFAPTLWTADRARTLSVLDAIAEARGAVPGGADILGAHLEGPYLSAARCGAQDPAAVRDADLAELEQMVATGAVARMTLAPERRGGDRLLSQLRHHGVIASLGHSDADAATAERAIAGGVTGVTHLFNAMRPLHHRDPGVVGVALADPRLIAELIVDLVHVHPVAIRAAWAAKGADGLALVTDALPPAGSPLPLTAVVDGRRIEGRGGALWLRDDVLAGSCLTLDAALRNLAAVTGLGPVQLWPTVSRTPARLCGIEGQRGDLVPGLLADGVLLDEDLMVAATIVHGAVVLDRRAGTAARSDGPTHEEHPT